MSRPQKCIVYKGPVFRVAESGCSVIEGSTELVAYIQIEYEEQVCITD